MSSDLSSAAASGMSVAISKPLPPGAADGMRLKRSLSLDSMLPGSSFDAFSTSPTRSLSPSALNHLPMPSGSARAGESGIVPRAISLQMSLYTPSGSAAISGAVRG